MLQLIFAPENASNFRTSSQSKDSIHFDSTVRWKFFFFVGASVRAKKTLAGRSNTPTQQCASWTMFEWVSVAIAILSHRMRYLYFCSLAFIWHLFCLMQTTLYNTIGLSSLAAQFRTVLIFERDLRDFRWSTPIESDIETELKALVHWAARLSIGMRFWQILIAIAIIHGAINSNHFRWNAWYLRCRY